MASLLREPQLLKTEDEEVREMALPSFSLLDRVQGRETRFVSSYVQLQKTSKPILTSKDLTAEETCIHAKVKTLDLQLMYRATQLMNRTEDTF